MSNPNPISSAYIGISFPPKKGAGYGFFDLSANEELLKQSIYVLLNTKKGSMPMNPSFGSSAQDLLWEPINGVTQNLIASTIQADIEKWEPRVTVIAINASSLNNDRYFDITLQVKNTQQLINYTHSFTA